jgi:hypothetical protein
VRGSSCAGISLGKVPELEVSDLEGGGAWAAAEPANKIRINSRMGSVIVRRHLLDAML